MKSIIIILICMLSIPLYSQDQSERIVSGKFKPTWESLSQYEVPDWFRDAKFGIWAHWGPQCQPEQGDWYARFMYDEGSRQYLWHIENYGHPSVVGFKDVIHDWKAESWDPEKLVKLYKRAGARYFFALGNHHDNFDLWDSKYQEWNSVNVGPEKNIIAGWAKAAKNNDLPFGISIHASHAWIWYETAQRSDKEGPYAGIPYDGNLTKADGAGTWWEGLDPRKLYVQDHPLSEGSENTSELYKQWSWGNGAALPSEEYCNNFLSRTIDVINKYEPDLIYFDDTGLPLWPVSDVGLKIAAHYYNNSIAHHNGRLEAVLFGKVLTDEQKECLVWDVERGAPDNIQEKPWQTCTCIGDWHYKRSIYENNGYKSAITVIRMLADIVSKNGNMLLNIPVRGDGTIDEKEIAILEEIADWMNLNSESIYGTRPWYIFGEGPVAESANPIEAQGFNEGKGKPYTSADIRFTKKGKTLYAIVMVPPDNGLILIKSLATKTKYMQGSIKKVELLGGTIADYSFDDEGLRIKLSEDVKTEMPLVFKISVN